MWDAVTHLSATRLLVDRRLVLLEIHTDGGANRASARQTENKTRAILEEDADTLKYSKPDRKTQENGMSHNVARASEAQKRKDDVEDRRFQDEKTNESGVLVCAPRQQ